MGKMSRAKKNVFLLKCHKHSVFYAHFKCRQVYKYLFRRLFLVAGNNKIYTYCCWELLKNINSKNRQERMHGKSDIERLFRQHYGEMYRLAVRLLHDEDEARDVVSSVFVRLLDDGSRPAVNLSYLLICVHGQCMNRIKHIHIREKVERLLALDIDDGAVQGVDDAELLGKVWRFIDKELTSQTRDIVVSRFVDSKSCSEIAGEHGITRQAVHKHIMQAVRKLRKHFG